jgi:hypothetical protein
MAGGTVALGRYDRFGNRSGVFPQDPVAEEDPDHEIGQFIDADGLWHRAILDTPPAGTTHGNTAPRRKWPRSRSSAAE